MPPILWLHFSLYALLLFAGLQSAMLALTGALAGEFYMASINALLAGFIFWYFGGGFIEAPLSYYLIRQLERGNFRKIDVAYSRALYSWQRLPIPRHQWYVRTLSNAGLMRMLAGDYDRSEPLMREAVQMLDRNKHLRRSDLSAILTNNLACLLIRRGDLEEAEKLAMKALQIYESKTGKSASGAAFPLINLGWLKLEQGQYEESERLLTRALATCKQNNLPPTILPITGTYTLMNCLFNLAVAKSKLDKLDECTALVDEALNRLALSDDCVTVTALEPIGRLADELISKQEYKRAERLLEYSYRIASHYPDHPDNKLILNSFADLLTLTDRKNEIADLNSFVHPILIGMT